MLIYKLQSLFMCVHSRLGGGVVDWVLVAGSPLPLRELVCRDWVALAAINDVARRLVRRPPHAHHVLHIDKVADRGFSYASVLPRRKGE